MSEVCTSGSSLLDYPKNNRNNFCGCWSVSGSIQHEGKSVRRFARLRCKRWSCERCGKIRLWQLRKAVIAKASELGLTRFLTLTVDHKDCSPEESVLYIRNAWNKFRTYLKRKYGKSITFISFVEPQKSGHAHLHILVDRYIDQQWISANWSAVGGGKIVDIRRADIHRISRYISKYLTKSLLEFAFSQKYRRYTTSRNIKLFEKVKNGLWILFTTSLDYLAKLAKDKIIESKIDPETGEIQWFNCLDPI